MGMQAALLPDGRRLHLHHGPIDLIIEADGTREAVVRAYAAASDRFATVLEELVSELVLLRQDVSPDSARANGRIARAMQDAVLPHWQWRVTPMAAVAGAVADEILTVMMRQALLRRAYVNNGGDIALSLGGGERFDIASAAGAITVKAEHGIGGIATSGWRGRSLSLGIADSVTVLARTASQADAAATLIANAVDLPLSPKVKREPAVNLVPDSDLRGRLVTTGVDVLCKAEVEEALDAGIGTALRMLHGGLIDGASLMLSGCVRYAGVMQVATAEREVMSHANG